MTEIVRVDLFQKRKEIARQSPLPNLNLKSRLLKRNPRKRQILNPETAKEDSDHLPKKRAKPGRVINAPETVKVVSKN